jgi:hypothetical protein
MVDFRTITSSRLQLELAVTSQVFQFNTPYFVVKLLPASVFSAVSPSSTEMLLLLPGSYWLCLLMIPWSFALWTTNVKHMKNLLVGR